MSKVNKITNQLCGRSLYALLAVLYFCCASLMHHQLRLCTPSSMDEAAQAFDVALLRAAQVAVPVLRQGVGGLVLRRLRQPSKLFGCGFRSCLDLRDAWFVGAVNMVVPHLVEFSPLCGPVVGADSFVGGGKYTQLMSDPVEAGGYGCPAGAASP